MTHREYRYEATGCIAHTRLSPLLPSIWKDNQEEETKQIPDFLWENAPRRETKAYRDSVKVYSHLPNGTNILDCKWALGRLFAKKRDDDHPLLATLETHCFRGLNGYERFSKKVQLIDGNASSPSTKLEVPDIVRGTTSIPVFTTCDLWIVKDAQANGAGGIWVVGPENADQFKDKETSPLYPEHRYVAQKYVWPPLLYDGKKFHVRVYGLLTCDGRAFVHHRAFLHVANDPFTTSCDGSGSFQESVHITNCCANSHDDSKFAGEILADLEKSQETIRDGERVVPLGAFFPSIQATFAGLAKRVFPFLQGGRANKGFEYCGMDFMLSHNENNEPVAYLLEINAPPSQDTATGLPHAENLHNDVIRDLISLWVLPNVIPGKDEIPGGWVCVHKQKDYQDENVQRELIVPSKAAILNKIRWALFEKKAIRKEEQEDDSHDEIKSSKQGTKSQDGYDTIARIESITRFARSQFPYFSSDANPQVFFESAGGSQVPRQVITAMTSSLAFRHRSIIGTKTKMAARRVFRELLGARNDPIILGANASSLLSALANAYVDVGLLTEDDEIILSTENHSANFHPWEMAAKRAGAKIRLWTPFSKSDSFGLDGTNSKNLENLLSSKTRIVALPHASNILGQLRDVATLARKIKLCSEGRAHVVVDGVAAVPHVFPDLEKLQVDWYVVSGQKMFGPHLGGLYGRRNGAVELFSAVVGSPSESDNCVYQLLERGTQNYEGCAGVVGLGKYFSLLASCALGKQRNSLQSGENCFEARKSQMDAAKRATESAEEYVLSYQQVVKAYDHIKTIEERLVKVLLLGLRRSSKVRIIEGSENDLSCLYRLPVVSIVHLDVKAKTICETCQDNGIACRVSSFLCTESLARDFDFDSSDGILRISLAHYNTIQEIDTFLHTVNRIPGWA